MSRRLLAGGLAGVVAGSALALAPTVQASGNAPASRPAASAEPASPLVLRSPRRVVERSHGGWVFSDFRARLVAVGGPFELRAVRDTAYEEPIRVTWLRGAGSEDDVTLPAGSMTTWQGLDHFTTVTVLADGKRVRRSRLTGCVNGDAVKVGPAGPARNPYPWGCPSNPYTLGSVTGIAQDYATPLFPWGGTSMRLRPGVYQVRSSITPRWRRFFGISAEDGTATSRLVVKDGGRRGGFRTERAEARRQATAGRTTSRSTLQPTAEAPTAAAEGEIAPAFAPDLRSLPAFDISMNSRGTAVRFGANVWNGGSGPLVIEGFKQAHDHPTGDGDHAAHMTAYQYFFDGTGQQTGYQQVGEFGYHAANHNHWHFEDFARYRLLHDDNGVPGGRAVRSTKASFCLANTDAVDYTVPNADWRPENTDLSSACGGRRATYLREVLSNGSGDTYHQFRAGQAFRVGNLPDGTYWISVEANPQDRNGRNLVELDYTNNDSVRRIVLGTNRRGERFVRPAKVGIVDERESGFFFRR